MIPIEYKDKIAQKYGYTDWKRFIQYEIHKQATTHFWGYIEEAANLYAKAKWEEACEAQKDIIAEEGLIALLKKSPEFKP